jgi:hypothetical protein
VEIVLLRHGMPKINKHRWLNAAGFGLWISEYNAAGIDLGCMPPNDLIGRAGRCSFIVCSDLPRSLESARVLKVDNIDICEPLFRELEMPHGNWRFPQLPTSVWVVAFRLLWAAGYTGKVEPFGEAKARARRCAEHLAEYASEHGTVLFVGHGSLNWFIGKYLKSMGWSGPSGSARRYWDYGVFCYNGTSHDLPQQHAK